MAAALDAMRLSSVIYLIPFLFVIEPDLILASGFTAALLQLFEIVPAVYVVAAGFQGWMPWFGNLSKVTSSLLITGGFLVALPNLAVVGIPVSEIWLNLSGLALVATALFVQYQFGSNRNR